MTALPSQSWYPYLAWTFAGIFFLILFPHLFVLFGGGVFVPFCFFERKAKLKLSEKGGEEDLGGTGRGENNQILY